MKLGRKVKKVTTPAAAMPASASDSGPNSLRPAADEADERDDHDQRPRCGLAQREPSIICAGVSHASVSTAPW